MVDNLAHSANHQLMPRTTQINLDVFVAQLSQLRHIGDDFWLSLHMKRQEVK